MFSGGPNQLVADFSMGDDGSVWVIDAVDRLWYTTGVKADKPQGDGQWWQASDVPLFYVLQNWLHMESTVSLIIVGMTWHSGVVDGTADAGRHSARHIAKHLRLPTEADAVHAAERWWWSASSQVCSAHAAYEQIHHGVLLASMLQSLLYLVKRYFVAWLWLKK